MIQSLYTGMHGMLSQQQNIDTIANNVANINTNGFKYSRVEFRDALYARMLSPTDNSPEVNLQRGTGALVYQTVRDMAQGARLETGGPLDFFLEGQGFFEARDAAGNLFYTRNGSFFLSAETDGNFLVDGQGNFILDDAGARIEIPGLVADLSVSGDGTLLSRNADGSFTTVARFGLYAFDNPAGLLDVGSGRYISSENSGAARPAADVTVHQGALEASNVDYAQEMVRLIRAQRAYQLASRCITTADQMAQVCNSIRT